MKRCEWWVSFLGSKLTCNRTEGHEGAHRAPGIHGRAAVWNCPDCNGAGSRGCSGGYLEPCDECGGRGKVDGAAEARQ